MKGCPFTCNGGQFDHRCHVFGELIKYLQFQTKLICTVLPIAAAYRFKVDKEGEGFNQPTLRPSNQSIGSLVVPYRSSRQVVNATYNLPTHAILKNPLHHCRHEYRRP